MKTFAFLLLALAIPTASAATNSKNIVQLAVDTSDLSTLVTALTKAMLTDTLSGAGPFTVFAPTNDAFAELPSADLSELLDPANTWLLIKVLNYHVANGDLRSSNLSDGQKIPTLQGSEVEVTITATGVKMINNAIVTIPDISASNGVVHLINAVLIPDLNFNVLNLVESVMLTGLSTLADALTKATLKDTLSGAGPFTLFAPTDDAFSKMNSTFLSELLLPAKKDALINVLKYHVYDGRLIGNLSDGQMIPTLQGNVVTVTKSMNDTYINTAKVLNEGDEGQEVLNGLLYVIDAVLIPPEAAVFAVGAAFNVSPTTKIAVITLLAAAVQFFGPQ